MNALHMDTKSPSAPAYKAAGRAREEQSTLSFIFYFKSMYLSVFARECAGVPPA